MSGQQSHRRAIYHPRRKSRLGKPLQKKKRSAPKIHPSNPSIHPNRLPRFHRSRLLWKCLQLHRSASRSRLAAVSLHHQRRSLSSHQRSSRSPSVRSRSQTPHRGNGPDATLIFGREIRSKSAHQRHNQKRLYQKMIQSVHGKQLHRTRSGKCSKRAISALPEQPPQLQKSWPMPRQKPSKS